MSVERTGSGLQCHGEPRSLPLIHEHVSAVIPWKTQSNSSMCNIVNISQGILLEFYNVLVFLHHYYKHVFQHAVSYFHLNPKR